MEKTQIGCCPPVELIAPNADYSMTWVMLYPIKIIYSFQRGPFRGSAKARRKINEVSADY